MLSGFSMFKIIFFHEVVNLVVHIFMLGVNPPKLMPINCLIGESSCVSIVLKGEIIFPLNRATLCSSCTE